MLTRRTRSCFNNITYIAQQVPALYSAATTGNSNTDPDIYGQINPYVLSYNDTVQIVINNIDNSSHPFHLHGHHFQVLDRAASGTGKWDGSDSNYASTPPMRDTVAVMPNSYAVLRFKATNPGVWLFHCHIEWHVEMGLTATLIEAPDRLRNMSFPDDHIDACKKMGTPYAGNAAGNTANVSDTSGFVTVPPTTYNGWVTAVLDLIILFYCYFCVFDSFVFSCCWGTGVVALPEKGVSTTLSWLPLFCLAPHCCIPPSLNTPTHINPTAQYSSGERETHTDTHTTLSLIHI